MDAFNATMARRVRAGEKFSFGFNAILPVQSYFKKYSASRLTQITSIFAAILPHSRGVSRSSRTRGGMRWTQAALLTRACAGGRRSRVVLTPRRWRQVCGGNSAGDGDNKARSPGRARRKPLKPLRREGRVSRRTCGDYSCAFYPLHTRLRVRRAPGFPCALVFEGTGRAQLGRFVSRDRGIVFEIGTSSLRGANGSQRRFRNAEAWLFEK
jgi:hypothetical protein